jgi:hypothetical protein
MIKFPNMLDANYCFRKADKYRAKAQDTSHEHDCLKSTYEAVARAYDLRAYEKNKAIAIASKFSVARAPLG